MADRLGARLRGGLAALAWLAYLLAGLVLPAQASVDMSRYRSAEEAQAAIDRATSGAAQAEQAYLDETRACYRKFLTTSCLDEAKERRRATLHALRDLEVEARAWLRKDKARQRDAALEEKRIADESDVRERQAEVKAREEALERKRVASEQKQREAAERDAKVVPDTRAQKQEQAMRERAERAEREAPQRARNVEAYRRKQEEAATKQRELEQRRAQQNPPPAPATPAK